MYYFEFPTKCHQNNICLYTSPLCLWQIQNGLCLWIDAGKTRGKDDWVMVSQTETWTNFHRLTHTKIMHIFHSNHSFIHVGDPISFFFGMIQRRGVAIKNKKIHPKFSFHQFGNLLLHTPKSSLFGFVLSSFSCSLYFSHFRYQSTFIIHGE